MDLSPPWQYILDVAKHRLENNITERHVSDYGEYIEVIGAAGELAARRFLQLNENLHVHFDGGCDILYKDIRIDVKATVWTPRLERRFLQWRITKPMRADVVLLTAVNCEKRSAIIRGYALRHEAGQAPINQTRDYPCFEIPVTRLHSASNLLFAQSLDDLHARPKAQTAHRQYSYGTSQGA
jgi:hypothetical protein